MNQLPVPRRRHDGWTPARQAEFLRTLADTGSVGRACAAVGLSRAAAYRLRRHPHAGDFRAGWNLAAQEALAALRDRLLERLADGDTEVTRRDGTITERHKPAPVTVARLLIDKAAALALLADGPAEAHAHALHALALALPDRPGWSGDAPDLDSPASLAPPPMPGLTLGPDSGALATRSRAARLRRPPRPDRPIPMSRPSAPEIDESCQLPEAGYSRWGPQIRVI